VASGLRGEDGQPILIVTINSNQTEKSHF